MKINGQVRKCLQVHVRHNENKGRKQVSGNDAIEREQQKIKVMNLLNLLQLHMLHMCPTNANM